MRDVKLSENIIESSQPETGRKFRPKSALFAHGHNFSDHCKNNHN